MAESQAIVAEESLNIIGELRIEEEKCRRHAAWEKM